MPILRTIEVHPVRTEKHGYQYQFTPKHHGADPTAAQWLPDLTLDEEFAVFNLADRHELFDERGCLYGIARSTDGLRYLGKAQEQIAEFPVASAGQPWHGYPIYPVNDLAPQNRRGEAMRPDKSVFVKMEVARVVTSRERIRLMSGKHV